jgi:gliding motility-associated transport system ATP-binding protein
MNSVSIKQISKSYPGVNALDNISFQLKKGEIAGLVGENGAGKTTCLRIMAGLMVPNGGTVRILGEKLYPTPEKIRKHIGYLPEGNPLPEELRINEYLSYAASIKGIKSNLVKKEKENMLALLGLKDVESRFIGDLSSGYRQRVGLAAAFLGWPQLILLDEPTRGLDPIQIESLSNIIGKASRRSTLLVSTHGLDQLERIAQRFIFLKSGKIIHDGTLPPDETSLRQFFLKKVGK